MHIYHLVQFIGTEFEDTLLSVEQGGRTTDQVYEEIVDECQDLGLELNFIKQNCTIVIEKSDCVYIHILH